MTGRDGTTTIKYGLNTHLALPTKIVNPTLYPMKPSENLVFRGFRKRSLPEIKWVKPVIQKGVVKPRLKSSQSLKIVDLLCRR